STQIRLFLAPIFWLTCVAVSRGAEAPAASNDRLTLTAEHSTGGTLITFAGGGKGVTLQKDSPSASEEPGIEWKPASPLAAGWWHGSVDFGPREGDDKGWVNYRLGFVPVTGGKPLVNLMANFHGYDKPPFKFEFWIYFAE